MRPRISRWSLIVFLVPVAAAVLTIMALLRAEAALVPPTPTPEAPTPAVATPAASWQPRRSDLGLAGALFVFADRDQEWRDQV